MRKRFIYSLLLVCGNAVLFSPFIRAQEIMPTSFQGLMHMLDSGEIKLMGGVGKSFVPTLPPQAPVINLAEFNRMKGALVAYTGGFGIPMSVIKEIAEQDGLTTIVSGSSQQSTVSGLYTSNGVNTANCNYLHAPVNSYWTRDYGPWFVIDGNDELGIVDFPYNRPRPDDDDIPVKLANSLGLNLFGMNLIHTGGNYMTDGEGISASSDLVYEENPTLDTTAIDSMVMGYLGVNTYHVKDDPLGLYIKHIDCWGKFLDVDKVIIAQVPVTDSRYADFEAVAAYFASEVSSYGNNYQVFRVYSPNGQPYTNSFILNKKVYVPIVNGSGSFWNDTALARYSQAMPGYEVIGFTQLSAAPWQTSDALHCRVIGVGDKEMLYIRHTPLLGTQLPQTGYQISARIISLGGFGLIPDSLSVIYRINNGVWQSILMNPDTNHWYKAIIPAQALGAEISYFIHAADSSGRSENHPFIGAPDPHTFLISPQVQVTEIERLITSMNLYPNPSAGITYVDFITNRASNTSVTVSNTLGQLVYEGYYQNIPSGHHQLQIDVSEWVNGLYTITIMAGDFRKSRRLLVKNY